MRDVIAVLDGMNVSASAGANYSGGSSWAAGFPTMPSSEGLAGYLAAFDGGNGYDVARVNPSASSGGNYSGGSSWAAGFPTYPSSEGLASMGPTGYDVTRVNPSASGGANYSGGSSWAAGFPLYPSSEGLASVRIRGALHGLTGGGVSPAAAVAIVRRAVQSGAIVAPRPGGTRIPHPCNAARDAAYSAAREAGFDLAFCEAAGVRAFNRCVAESWATYGTNMSDLREYLALLGEAPRFAPPGRGYLPAGPAPTVWGPPAGSRTDSYRQVLAAARGTATLHPAFVDLIVRGFSLGTNRSRWGLSISSATDLVTNLSREGAFPAISRDAMIGAASALVTRAFDPDFVPGR